MATRISLRGRKSFKQPTTATALKDGQLHKRQRGKRKSDLRGLKFQQRYCQLTPTSLKYYSNKKDAEPSGVYQVAKIKIVEKVPDKTFRKPFCFQIGNEREVMYFCANSELERDEWIQTFKIAAFDLRKNPRLSHYHLGAFGHLEQKKWSCCYKDNREAKGCEVATPADPSQVSLHPKPQAVDSSIYQEDSTPKITQSLPSPVHGFDEANKLPLSRSYAEWDSIDEDPGSYSESDSTTYDDEENNNLKAPAFTGSRQSVFSEDSGKGNSTGDLTNIGSPAPGPRHITYSGLTKRRSQDSILSSPIIEEYSTVDSYPNSNSPRVHRKRREHQSSPSDQLLPKSPDTHFVYSHKNAIEHSGSTSQIVYRGEDVVITATKSGEVYTSRVNLATPETELIAAATVDNEKVASISVSENYLALGSTMIHLVDMDLPDKKRKLIYIGESQDSEPALNLVSFSPDGSLFSASKGTNTIHVWPKPDESWLQLKSPSKPACTFKVSEDGDRIFSLCMCSHPEQPWIAIGVTSAKDSSDHVHIYNYETKEYMHRIEIGQDSELCCAFTHDGQHLFMSSDNRLQCFNITTKRMDSFSYSLNEDASITSICCSPVRHHLAVGLSSGEVKVFVGNPMKQVSTPDTMTGSLKTNKPVTSLAYSRDGMKTAVGFGNGNVQIWRGSRPPKEEPLVRTGTLLVTRKGLTYHSLEDEFTITIPEGAVEEGTTVKLQYGVAPNSPFGPYEFKDGARPVSTILSLCPTPVNTIFLKPIEVTLPHFMACDTSEDCEKLSFYKAPHDNYRVEDGEKIYQFEKVTDGEWVPFSRYFKNNWKQKTRQGAVTLYTRHCCDLCIAQSYSEDETNKAIFFLCQAVPREPNLPNEYNVVYCLVYFLPTCMKTFDEQFPVEQYGTSDLAVNFQASADHNQHQTLRIKFSKEKMDGGWQLKLGSIDGEIEKREMCFWKYAHLISALCERKRYPIRIILTVHPGMPIEAGVKTVVSFSGVEHWHTKYSREPSFCLELAKPVQSPIIGVPASRLLSSSTSSFKSSRSRNPSSNSIADAVASFEESFDHIANVADPKKLASALFSASSPRKCPNIDRSLLNSKLFLKMAKSGPSEDKFSTNFEILTYVMDILENHPGYILAVQSALDSALPDSENILREQPGLSQAIHSREGSAISMVRMNKVGYATAEEDLSGQSDTMTTLTSFDHTPTVTSTNGYITHGHSNGFLTEPASLQESNGPEHFSNAIVDPNINTELLLT